MLGRPLTRGPGPPGQHAAETRGKLIAAGKGKDALSDALPEPSVLGLLAVAVGAAVNR